MRVLIVLAVAVVVCGFKMDDAEKKVFSGTEAREAVEAYGFTDVKIEGPAFYGCGRDYTIANEFTAIGPRGHKVWGIACGAFVMKGWSIKIWKVEQPGASNSQR